jgi:hypothetical protein
MSLEPNVDITPTTPGFYWFHSEVASRPVLVEVRLINDELIVVWPPRADQPVAKMKGHWRGPLRPSPGAGGL